MKTVAKSFEELKNIIDKENSVRTNSEFDFNRNNKFNISFKEYVELSYSDKKAFWKQLGLNTSVHELAYGIKTELVNVGIRNPFNGNKLKVKVDFNTTLKYVPHLSKKVLIKKRKNSFFVCGMFCINKNPEDINDLLFFKHMLSHNEIDKLARKDDGNKKNKIITFERFKILSDDEKIAYLVKNGVKFSIINFSFSPITNSLGTNVINPITGKRIRFRCNEETLGTKPIVVKGRLLLNRDTDNESQMFDYKLYPNEENADRYIDKKEISHNYWDIDEKLIEQLKDLKLHERIYFDDYVALHDTKNCSVKGHDLEKIKALIFILQRKGNIIHKYIPAWYCHTCKRFFITQWQYEDISDYGVPLCQVIKDQRNFKENKTGDYFDELDEESILHRSGYNVSAKDDLSKEQRERILILLLDSGLCNWHKIDSHLTWLIDSRSKNTNMINAVKKWEEDRRFISEYKFDAARVVGIKLIRNIKKRGR